MSWAILIRLGKLDEKDGLDGSTGNLTDEELFSACRDLIERASDIEVFAADLQVDGDCLAVSALVPSSCRTAAEFVALGA